ncbi:MAG: hypothetical protein V4619_12690 [Bacteroidota bacterium]
MKRGLHKQVGCRRQNIVRLLLLVFCSFLLAEISHTHKPFIDERFSVNNSTAGAVVKHPQSFCKFCDYLVHQSHSLAPLSCHFTAAPTWIIHAAKFAPVRFVYTISDLLLFSGNSPPLAQ